MEQVAEPGELCNNWLLGCGRLGRHLEVSPLGGDQGAAAVGQHEQQVQAVAPMSVRKNS